MNEEYRLYSSLGERTALRKWAEVDLGALRSNYRLLRDTSRRDGRDPRPIAVVKADAYGHGAPACVEALLSEGCDFFAVSEIAEAIAVRRICNRAQKNADVLILGYTSPDDLPLLLEYDLIQTAVSEEHARLLSQAARDVGKQLRVHLAVDTGMNRIGLLAHSESEIAEAAEAAVRILAMDGLTVEGAFTHFAHADEETPVGRERTELQSERYHAWKRATEAHGGSIPFHHICNTVASVLRPIDRMDGVRLGISLYGAAASPNLALPVRPVMRLRTTISHLHTLLPDEGVSYGGEFSAHTPRTVATLPIGYADGLFRAAKGMTVTLETEAGEFPAPILGRICMDQCMIDVTDLGARIGDTVTLFGSSQSPLSAYAQSAQTIEYECLCLVSARVPRVYRDGAQLQ